jgi:hypothetical protein
MIYIMLKNKSIMPQVPAGMCGMPIWPRTQMQQLFERKVEIQWRMQRLVAVLPWVHFRWMVQCVLLWVSTEQGKVLALSWWEGSSKNINWSCQSLVRLRSERRALSGHLLQIHRELGTFYTTADRIIAYYFLNKHTHMQLSPNTGNHYVNIAQNDSALVTS